MTEFCYAASVTVEESDAAYEARREAWMAMRELAHDHHHLERVHRIVAEAGLTPGLAKALGRIPLAAPVAMRELAGLLHCDSSYVTSVVDALEEHGLAERNTHPTDRRVKVVTLTAAGEQLVRRVRDAMATPPPVFEILSAEETEQLRDLMRKLDHSRRHEPELLTTRLP